ncbi:TPA: fimbrial chaperone [Photobacterium damselae]
MNKFKIMGALGLLILSHQAMAAFVLTGTRFIYDEGARNIPVIVDNEADTAYGGQVWIDNTEQPADNVYMVPAPSFFRVDAQDTQVVRLMNVNPNLPKDRESLFWLNVMEVPPKPKGDGNQLAFAMNTKVKLIYRPNAIKSARQGAEKAVKLERMANRVLIKNPTPYYFAISTIQHNGKPIKITGNLVNQLGTFKPFSEVDVTSMNLPSSGTLTFEALNDWGGAVRYTF